MKRGLVWGICAFNMIASGVAIFMVARPYFRAQPATATLSPPPPAQAASADWKSEIEIAANLQQLHQALTHIPDNNEDAKRWLQTKITDSLRSDRMLTDAWFMDRLLAEIGRWGQLVSYGEADSRQLEAIVDDPDLPILVRTVALQGLAESAFRRHKAETSSGNGTPASDWCKHWHDVLSRLAVTTVGTSLQGQSLQILNACQQQGLVSWPEQAWDDSLSAILAPGSASDESSIITALNLASSRAVPDAVRGAVKDLAHGSRSEMLKSAAIIALGKVGDAADCQWLDHYQAESVKISQAQWAAREQIRSRFTTP